MHLSPGEPLLALASLTPSVDGRELTGAECKQTWWPRRATRLTYPTGHTHPEQHQH